MPEYLTPGVYIEEFEIGAKPIEGVSTSTAGFLGETERGPIKPRLVTSWPDYQRIFGGMFDDTKFLPFAVQGFFLNGGKRCFIARITDKEGALSAQIEVGSIRIKASGPGEWGNRVAVVIRPGSTEGFRLLIAYWKKAPEALFDPFDPNNAQEASQPTMTEEFDDLVMNENSPNYFDKRVNNGLSNLVELEPIGEATEVPPEQAIQFLAGGVNGDPVVLGDYEGESQDVDNRTGLAALKQPEYRDIAIVYAPNANEIDNLAGRIMTHCENNKYRFAIIDSPKAQKVISQVDPRSTRNSKYAAFYYPWIKIVDSESGKRKLVPPGGHVAGIYARSDIERGVFKAPANETVRGAVELEFPINDDEQAILNPRGVNCIRSFPGRGNRVWGSQNPGRRPAVEICQCPTFIHLSGSVDIPWNTMGGLRTE